MLMVNGRTNRIISRTSTIPRFAKRRTGTKSGPAIVSTALKSLIPHISLHTEEAFAIFRTQF
jgi:hypothetical protein